MWTRAQLKEKGKATFKNNYWKTVFVSLLLALLLGGASHSFSVSGSNGSDADEDEFFEQLTEQDPATDDAGAQQFLAELNDLQEKINALPRTTVIVYATAVVIAAVIALMVGVAIAITVDAFIINPLAVGARRFFIINLNHPAEVKEIAYAFDHNYKNIVKTAFFRDLYVVLWSLLLIIPGIVKAYEYRMVTYLLAENPDMAKGEAFALSRQMMDGQKWNTFVLDLSFIGWRILSVLTIGILSIFYVNPYKNMTDAALYETLNTKRVAESAVQE